jgi:hypothetical protein
MESGLMGAFFYHQFWGFPNFCDVSQANGQKTSQLAWRRAKGHKMQGFKDLGGLLHN